MVCKYSYECGVALVISVVMRGRMNDECGPDLGGISARRIAIYLLMYYVFEIKLRKRAKKRKTRVGRKTGYISSRSL